jgi:hypothetical protein
MTLTATKCWLSEFRSDVHTLAARFQLNQ